MNSLFVGVELRVADQLRRIRSSRAIGNIAWLVFERAAMLVLSVVIGVWTARYLGPQKFGAWNFLLALSGLLMVLPSLGLDKIALRDFVNDPAASAEILGSSFGLRAIGGSVAVLIFIAVLLFGKLTDASVVMPGLVLATVLPLKAFDAVLNLFEAKLTAKPMVYSRMLGQIISQLLRIPLILWHTDLIWFVGTSVIESGITAIGFLFAVTRFGLSPSKWRWSQSRARSMLHQSWPLAISSIAIVLYMRLDQVMLTAIGGTSMTGQYAAATRISEAWYFVPTAIASSLYPALIEAHRRSDGERRRVTSKLMQSATWLSYIIAIPASILAPQLCHYLYGDAFAESGQILRIHMLGGIFVAQGVAMGPWLMVKDMQKFALWTTLGSAGINVILNLLFIPLWGGSGAALATLMTQGGVTVIVSLAYPPARELGVIMVRSLFLLRYVPKRG